MEIFSSRLKELRELKRMSQKEMAEAIGVSQPYYFKFEKGNGEPNLETLCKIADILGVNIDYILGREGKVVTKTEYDSLELRITALEERLVPIEKRRTPN